ncbi:hypothetical protein RCL1_002465 [Eukaryota sp. TZLM3-RCL]
MILVAKSGSYRSYTCACQDTCFKSLASSSQFYSNSLNIPQLLSTPAFHSTSSVIYIEPVDLYIEQTKREELLSSLFSVSTIRQVCITPEPLLALYSIAQNTGIVVNIGHETASICTVLDGVIIPDSVISSQNAGKKITEELINSINGQEFSFDFWNNVKHENCFIKGIGIKTDTFKRQIYPIPGKFECNFLITKEATECCEVLFNGENSIINSIKKAINYIPDSLNRAIPILICGGSSKLVGIGRRISLDLNSILIPKPYSQAKDLNLEFRVVISEFSEHTALRGLENIGEIFGNDWFISREEFDRFGPGIVHSKCF